MMDVVLWLIAIILAPFALLTSIYVVVFLLIIILSVLSALVTEFKKWRKK